MTDVFGEAAMYAVSSLPRQQVETLAARLDTGASDSGVLDAVPLPAYRDVAARVLTAVRASGTDPRMAATQLRAMADGYAAGLAAQRIDVVWSGPGSSAVPVRATAQVLADLIGQARRELILMTYSARQHPLVTQALTDAFARAVSVNVVVETLAGARGALAGEEPAAAIASIPGVELWHWPVARRPEQSSKMHAKLAVADSTTLLVTTGNFTHSGIDKNIEVGLLVTGGRSPVRVIEHIRQLQASGVLQRLL